ncbi:MAG: hypothetical protein ACOYL6_15285 [Bacteriovoracaceae bacterium]
MKKIIIALVALSSISSFAQSYKCDFVKNDSEQTTKGPNDLVVRNGIITIGKTTNFNLSSNQKISVDLYKTDDGKQLSLRVLFFPDSSSPYAKGQINAYLPLTQDSFSIGTSYDMPAPDYFHTQNLFVGCKKL